MVHLGYQWQSDMQHLLKWKNMQKTNGKTQWGQISKVGRGGNKTGMQQNRLLTKNMESFTICFVYLGKMRFKNRILNAWNKQYAWHKYKVINPLIQSSLSMQSKFNNQQRLLCVFDKIELVFRTKGSFHAEFAVKNKKQIDCPPKKFDLVLIQAPSASIAINEIDGGWLRSYIAKL